MGALTSEKQVESEAFRQAGNVIAILTEKSGRRLDESSVG